MKKVLSKLQNPLKELSQQIDESLTIRKATERDIPQIIAISQTTNSFKMSNLINEIDEQELRFWISDKRSVVLVSVFNSVLLGYAYGFCISPKWFFFDELVVSPRVRGIGVGKKMYAYLREKCQKRGLQLIQGLVKESKIKTLKYWTVRGFHKGSKCIWVEDWLYKD